MRKLSQRSPHDAIITIFILAQKGKMAFKTPFVPRELNYGPGERKISRHNSEELFYHENFGMIFHRGIFVNQLMNQPTLWSLFVICSPDKNKNLKMFSIFVYRIYLNDPSWENFISFAAALKFSLSEYCFFPTSIRLDRYLKFEY